MNPALYNQFRAAAAMKKEEQLSETSIGQLMSSETSIGELLEKKQREASDELRSPRTSPQRARGCGHAACSAERVELNEQLKIAQTEAKHLEAELRRVQVENTRLASHAQEAGVALEVRNKQLFECQEQLELLKPLRMQHLKTLLKSVVQKKLMRRRVRCMASLLREAKVPCKYCTHSILNAEA